MKTNKTIFAYGKERKINVDNYGYEKFRCPIRKNMEFVHRYIWEQANGKIPDRYHIHHKDENKLNNNLDNLELISASEHTRLHNPGNKTFQGGSVHWHKRDKKWRARMYINTKQKFLGYFHTKQEAYEALFKHDPIYWTQNKQQEILKEQTK